MGNVSKFVGGVPLGKLNCPPNNCIPSKANIRMKRKSRNKSDIILLIEFKSEITRFLKLAQYFVTLNILNKRNARRTERPNEPDLTADHITSNIEPNITTQSKRLKLDSKYILGPSAYILINISHINSPRNINSVRSKRQCINN